MDPEDQLADLQDAVELLTLDKEQLLLDKDILEERCAELEQQLKLALSGTGTGPSAGGALEVDHDELDRVRRENEQLREALYHLKQTSIADKEALAGEQERALSASIQCEELLAFKERAELEIEELKQSVDSMSSFETLIERLTNENMELSAKLKETQQTVLELEDAHELNEELDFQQRKQIDADRATIETLNLTISSQAQQLRDKSSALGDAQKKADQMKETISALKSEVERLNVLMSVEFRESREIEEKLRRLRALEMAHEEVLGQVRALETQCHRIAAQKRRYQAISVRMDSIFGGVSYYIEESKVVHKEVMLVAAVANTSDLIRDVESVASGLVVRNTPAGELRRMCQQLAAHALTAHALISVVVLGVLRDPHAHGLDSAVSSSLALKDRFDATSSMLAALSRDSSDDQDASAAAEDLQRLTQHVHQLSEGVQDLSSKLPSPGGTDLAQSLGKVCQLSPTPVLALEALLLTAQALWEALETTESADWREGLLLIQALLRAIPLRGPALAKGLSTLLSSVLAPLVRESEATGGSGDHWAPAVACLRQLSEPGDLREGAVILRFFPNCAPLPAGEQEQCVERFWQLLSGPTDDLLFASDEAPWKLRLPQLRAAVNDRFGGPAAPPAAPAAVQALPSPSGAVAPMVPKSRLDGALHELEEKRDELRAALNRVASLELHAAELEERTRSGPAVQPDAVQVTADLQKEVLVLEAALQAAEARAEAHLKEVKALKQASTTAGGAEAKGLRRGLQSAMNLHDAAAAVGEEKHLTPSSRSSASLLSLLAAGGGAAGSAALPVGAAAAPSTKSQLEEAEFWRLAALRRLTQSLAPLPCAVAPNSAPTADPVPTASSRVQRVRGAVIALLTPPELVKTEPMAVARRVRQRERQAWVQIFAS